MDVKVDGKTLTQVLVRYGISGGIVDVQPFFDYVKPEKGTVKVIYGVTLADGRKRIVKLLNEPEESRSSRENVEKQSRFSEHLRNRGIDTPKRYSAEGTYCTQTMVAGVPCVTTVEDWSGEEIRFIDPEISQKIGALMARMHAISLEDGLKLDAETLFSAAYDNDVDAWLQFTELVKAEGIDGATVARITALRQEKLTKIRDRWNALPRCAVQGDVSVNNLVLAEDGHLKVFDYNNAGDEVCVGDLILEGLLTAYEMDLPEGVPQSSRDQLFAAFVKGYLSARPLTPDEQELAWEIYTLWHGLWFTRVVYNEDSLQKLLERGEVEKANQSLMDMLRDMEQENIGLFSSTNDERTAEL